MRSCLVNLYHGDEMMPFLLNSQRSLDKSGTVFDQKFLFHTGIPSNDLMSAALEFKLELVEIKLEINKEYSEYGTKNFNLITAEKWRIINDVLNSGFELAVYADLDIYYISNFLPFIKQAQTLYSMGMQSEAMPAFPPYCCTGFMFFSGACKELLNELYKLNILNISKGNDQQLFNSIYRRTPKLIREIYLLPEALFQNGLAHPYHTSTAVGYAAGYLKPFLFHANYVQGLSNKISLLKHVEMWNP